MKEWMNKRSNKNVKYKARNSLVSLTIYAN